MSSTQPAAHSPIETKNPARPDPEIIHTDYAAEGRLFLDTINSQVYDREPLEYYYEKRYVEERRLTCPGYAIAARSWLADYFACPEALMPQLKELFQIPRSFQFVQWVLEHAKLTYPEVFASGAHHVDAVLDLTDALCDGSVSPLHIASALGLSEVVRYILANSDNDNVDQLGYFGTPLHCALVGPVVFQRTEKTQVDDNQIHRRAEIATYLLDANATICKCLAGPALWMAQEVDDPSILFRVFKDRTPEIDGSFHLYLQLPEFIRAFVRLNSTKRILAAAIYDAALLAEDEPKPWAKKTMTVVRETLLHDFTEFQFQAGYSRLNYVEDDDFDTDVRVAIAYSDELRFHRLTCDPRFDPQAGSSADLDEPDGTIAHCAVEEFNVSIIKRLHQVGGNFASVDREGRTPLMLAEKPRDLATLIGDLHLPSTDVDNEGRNIWHYMAETSDEDCIRWLCSHDPSKKQNLATKTKNGCTPLARALFAKETMKQDDIESSSFLQPTVIFLLLNEGAPLAWPFSRDLLSRILMSWGNTRLLDAFLKRGVGLNQDQSGE